MKRVTIPIVIRQTLAEEIDLAAKRIGLSRSRHIENIIEEHLLKNRQKGPLTFKEKAVHYLLTGEELTDNKEVK